MIHLVQIKKEDEDVLQRLLQFYIYEFTRFNDDITLESNGSYQPFELQKYWKENSLYHAFFIKYETEIIGFALLEAASGENPNVIEEFFIIRKYHGNGFGRIAAQRLFSMFEGKWKVVQIENNYPAQAFWRKTIREYTSNNFQERYDQYRRSIQEFDTRQLS